MKTDKEIIEFLKHLLPVFIDYTKEREKHYKDIPPLEVMLHWHEGKRLMAELILEIINSED